MKKTIIFIVIVVLAGAGYWYGARAGWFTDRTPSNLPTRAELERIEEIKKSSSEIAPNAEPGVGVRPVGSLPPATTQTPQGNTEEPIAEPGDEQGVGPEEEAKPLPLP